MAIALYFAIMKVSPPPFCMLDEIEAALDDVNVDRFAAYLRRMTNNTQFIVITHRRGSMEEADVCTASPCRMKVFPSFWSCGQVKSNKTRDGCRKIGGFDLWNISNRQVSTTWVCFRKLKKD